MDRRARPTRGDGLSGIVPIGDKSVTRRTAEAAGTLHVRPETARLIAEGGVPKGDVLTIARTAAVMAAKRTPEILPFCHPVPLTRVDVDFDLDESAGTLGVRVQVEADYRTGVEMEAITAASVALLTAWDLVKPLEKDVEGQYPTTRIHDLRVTRKVKG